MEGRPRVFSNCLLPRNHEGNLMSAIKYLRWGHLKKGEIKDAEVKCDLLASECHDKRANLITYYDTLIVTPDRREIRHENEKSIISIYKKKNLRKILYTCTIIEKREKGSEKELKLGFNFFFLCKSYTEVCVSNVGRKHCTRRRLGYLAAISPVP